MQIVDYGSHFLVSIPFNRQFKNNVKLVKELDLVTEGDMLIKLNKVKWIHDKKVWYIHNDLRDKLVEISERRRFTISIYQEGLPQITGEIPELPDLDFELKIKATLRPYQRQGVARGIYFKKVLIGDEPGLGKTLQSIGILAGLHQKGENPFPALVICPASLKENWKREIEKFSHYKAAILTDSIRTTWDQYYKVGMVQIFIVNYESLKKYFVKSMPPTKKLMKSSQIEMNEKVSLINSVVIDESHRIKEASTLQTKLCARIALGKSIKILLSGTPVMNKPIDLYTQLVVLDQMSHFGHTKKGFLDRYCDGGRGASNLKELNYLLNKHCFFRREKKDVAKDLPEKQRQRIVCDITTRQEYLLAEQNFTQFLRNSGATKGEIDKKLRAEALVQINALKAISARGKIRESKEFIDEILDAGEKLIVFCNLKSIVQELKALYPKAGTITGSDTMEGRQRNIDAFQNDPDAKLIICNFKAAGVGVTLTASSRVLFLEYPWTYADLVQAEDRAHRIGQKNTVMTTFLLGKDTIDERMFDLILEKKEIANAITGGTDEMDMSTIDRMINLFVND